MGLIISKQEDIDAYFESDALRQSTLKKLIKGMDSFLTSQVDDDPKRLHYSENNSFIIGSGVDVKLTGEFGQYEKDNFVSRMENKPSDVEMSIIRNVFHTVVEDTSPVTIEREGVENIGTLSDHRGSILSSCDELGWQSRWKDETRINKIIEVGTLYFEDLKKSFGKQILSVEEDTIINEIAMSLTTNPRTAMLFDRETLAGQQNVDVYYQLPIYFEYKGVQCKALLDMLWVVKDDNNRIISVKPIDLKTTVGDTLYFPTKVKTFRYDIQAAWYTLAVTYWLKEHGVFDDIEIKPFEFVVESNTLPGRPLIFRCTEAVLDIGKLGRKEVYIERNEPLDNEPVENNELVIAGINTRTEKYTFIKELKGYDELLDDYLYYEENNWQEEKVVKENNGVLEFDWNGII
jgi:hypothetical protein